MLNCEDSRKAAEPKPNALDHKQLSSKINPINSIILVGTEFRLTFKGPLSTIFDKNISLGQKFAASPIR
jgi:hypothetical protein